MLGLVDHALQAARLEPEEPATMGMLRWRLRLIRFWGNAPLKGKVSDLRNEGADPGDKARELVCFLFLTRTILHGGSLRWGCKRGIS